MKKQIYDFNAEVQKKLESLAKLEKTSKVAILKTPVPIAFCRKSFRRGLK